MKSTSQLLAACFLASDLLATAFAWLAAYWVRFESGLIPIYRDVPNFRLCLASLPLVLILSVVAYRYVGLYQVHRLRRFREEMVAVSRGVIFSILLITATTFAGRSEYESRIVLALYVAISFVAILIGRRLCWSILGRLRSRGYNQSHALIVGSGRLARRTTRALENASWMGIQVVAYVDDKPEPFPLDRPLLGPIPDLSRLVNELHIEHVFIALPMNRYSDARRVFDALAQTVVDVRLVADVPALSAVSLTTSYLHGMTFIGLRESPYYGLNVVVKRAMDILLSGLMIFCLAPLMLLIAILIRLTSPGPILFRQERCSLNGQPFQMLKFRTMIPNAEVQSGPVWTSKDDPRRTRIGSILRATNLDELPQLFNVLRGEMSLVGPRPERPVFVDKFKNSIPNYMARHAVKCGMTGWAQVNGWRGNSSLRKRIQYDLYYITHWNPLFDLRILALTAWSMLFRRQKNAY